MKDHLKMMELVRHFRIVKNASPSWEYSGSMIQYWKNATGINLSKGWICPKCRREFKGNELHGAHVVYYRDNNEPQFITPLCKECNEEKKQDFFVVHEKYLIPAPRPEN